MTRAVDKLSRGAAVVLDFGDGRSVNGTVSSCGRHGIVVAWQGAVTTERAAFDCLGEFLGCEGKPGQQERGPCTLRAT